jgi:hypothetical protein
VTTAPQQQRTRVRTPTVQLADGGLIDPIMLAIIHHHADTEEDRFDLVDFARTGINGIDQLRIMLKHLGNRRRLLMDAFSSQTSNGRLPGRNGSRLRNVDCTVSLNHGRVRWGQGILTLNHLSVPATIMATLEGRPITDVVDHPYLGGGMLVQEVRALGSDRNQPSMGIKLRMP